MITFSDISDVIIDAIKDGLIIFPFLFAVYMVMEVIESAQNKEKIERALSGQYAPLFASVAGIIPECGFSVMCAKLFDKGLIGFGTLIAAFIATNDEGLIILLSSGTPVFTVFTIILWKVIFASFVGITLNLLIKNFSNRHVCPVKDDCIECGEHHGGIFDKFAAHPFFHAAKTFFYILAVNLVFGMIIAVIGEDVIITFISESENFQPLITALIGLVPNCASSVILSRGYVYGIITLPALIAGLAANSGVGFLVLFKNKANIKKNLVIIFIMYLCGVALGYLSGV